MDASPPPPPLRILIQRNGQNFGPYTPQEINQHLAEKRLCLQDSARAEGTETWTTLAAVLNIRVEGTFIEDSAALRLVLPIGTSPWAIVSSYLGLFSVLIFPAPFALITGILAIRDILLSRKSGKIKYGIARSIFGVILGALGTIVGLGILCYVAFEK